jgi:hypothetical protein
VAVTVTDPVTEAPVATLLPRSTPGTLKLPWATPVPLRLTASVLVIDNTPLTLPTAVGWKTTEMLQLPAAGTEAQVSVMLNAPDPVICGTIATAWAPELVMVTTCAGLGTLTSTLPKVTVTLSIESVPAGPPSGGGMFVMPSGPRLASRTAGLELLPPQPATASMPTSPKQAAWSNRSKFLEHVVM